MRNFIREKKITCGETYMEVDLFPYTKTQQEMNQSGKRSKKKKESSHKQKNLNDKNAKRYFILVMNGNFYKGDYYITLTYKRKYQPKSVKEAEVIAKNYLRRLSYQMRKVGLELKYMLVTEHSLNKDGSIKNIHHHMVMNKGISRDLIEDKWCVRRKKGELQGESMGIVTTDRLQPDENGLVGLGLYISKDPKGKKRWSSSQNLVRPESRSNDHKYSKREIEKLAKTPFDKEYWKRKYPGWEVTSEDYGIEKIYYDQTGWSIYLKFRKVDTT